MPSLYIRAKARINAIVLIIAITASNSFANSVIYPPIESPAGTPDLHTYKSLDFGVSSINGQRIQIRSHAPSGVAVESSQLDIINAGIQAGYIAPVSHAIDAGTSCSSDQMGMIAQQIKSDLFINSQLQCMYNPTFCSAPGYCYLPLKTSTVTYQYITVRTSAQCPSGTIVDANQPSDGVRSNTTCPDMPSGWNLSQGPHGVLINGYTSVITGFSYYTGYETVCDYTNNQETQQVAVAALVKLKCTNDSTTFIIDNYTP